MIKDALDDCYCINMNSLNTEVAIYYCGGHYEKCDIYQKYLKKENGFHS